MNQATNFVLSEVVKFFRNWPNNGDEIAIFLAGGFAFALLSLLFYSLAIATSWPPKPEEEPREIPETMAALTLNRNSFWVTTYHKIWHRYPRDICTYFWGLMVMLVLGFLVAVATLGIALPLVSRLYLSILAIPILIVSVINFIASGDIINALASMSYIAVRLGGWVGYLALLPLIQKIAIGLMVVVGTFLFLRSHIGKVLILWLKAKKLKFCPLIRIV